VSGAARSLAALIAVVALGAVAVQHTLIVADAAGDASALARLWVLLRFFTILSNLFLGGVMLAVALGARPGPDLLATVTLAIVLVGGVYHTLLAQDLTGVAWWADHGLHTATPVLAAVWWLAHGGHGLRLRRLWVWLTWPTGYCLYALARGQADGIYPYFFIDLGRLGASQVALNIAGLVAAFGLAGVLLWACAKVRGRTAA
jgi:hypothetical protein